MTTYEQLVDATLSVGTMPLVVPQLRTITIGGAVTGLGIESSSFRNGLPHESVREMEILTGSGDIVVARPDNEHADLFRAFPNSYGSLGYALRLEIELERVHRFVRLRHVRFHDIDALVGALDDVVRTRSHDGEDVDFVDGVVFSAEESYLTLGTWADEAPSVSDYTGQEIYYRSIQRKPVDHLSARDYLWRWDTDWFWCSRAFGVQNPRVRRLWPRRYLRSDAYSRLIRFENQHHWAARWDARRGPPRARAGGAGRRDPDRAYRGLPALVPARGPDRADLAVPAALRDTAVSRRGWPLYPLEPGATYVNVGFWSTVAIAPGGADGDVNRAIEREVRDLGGHKSLYSDSYYDEDEFWSLYGGETYSQTKKTYDPDHRLPGLYDKAVRRR